MVGRRTARTATATCPTPAFPRCARRSPRRLAARTGLPFTAEHILMTVGAAGACNVVLKVDPRSRRRSHRPGSVLPRVPVLHREPRRRDGAGRDRRGLPAGRRTASPPPSPRAPRRSSSTRPTIPPARVYPAEVLRELERAARAAIRGAGDQRRAVPVAGVRRPERARSAAAHRAHAGSRLLVEGHARSRASASATWPSRRASPDAAALRDACDLRQPHSRLRQRAGHLAVGDGRGPRNDRGRQPVPGQARPALRRAGAHGLRGRASPQARSTFFRRRPSPTTWRSSASLLEEGILAVPGSGFGRAGLHPAVAHRGPRRRSRPACRDSRERWRLRAAPNRARKKRPLPHGRGFHETAPRVKENVDGRLF